MESVLEPNNAAASDDDPFDVFGEAAPSTLPAASLLDLAAAARKRTRDDVEIALAPFMDSQGKPVEVGSPSAPLDSEGSSRYIDALAIWPTHRPFALGPLRLSRGIDGIGGARGFVAARNVQPGEVLMAEAPLLTWPTAERHALPLLRSLLERPRPERAALLRALRWLHPERLEEVPLAERRRLAAEHAPTIAALLPLWSRTDEGVDAEEEAEAEDMAAAGAPEPPSPEAWARGALLRLCLVVSWNAFEGGLFLHQSLFNHAPSRAANCDKSTQPAPGRASSLGSARTGAGSAPGATTPLSVIRATRPIAAGSECFICYCQPPELSAVAAARHLAQFDFVPSYARDLVGWDTWPVPVPAAAAGAMADVAGAPLRTQAEADALTLSLEDRATRALRIALRSGTMGCEWRCEDMGCGGEDTGGGSAAGESGCGGEASICLVDATAVIDALAARLGSSHLAVATARRTLIEGLRRQLQRQESAAAPAPPSGAAVAVEAVGVEALCVLLTQATELWACQRALLGPVHPECALTLFDVAQCLARLLGTAPATLFARFPRWGTAALASHAERRAATLHAAIAALYSGPIRAYDPP
jgi:hypothetical protein